MVPVVAAVVHRDGAYLVGRRPAHKRHGGLWEFPGGKVGEGESDLDASRRELEEELGLHVEAIGAMIHEAMDPGSHYLIRFVEAVVSGEPQAIEHSEVGWFTAAELVAMPLAPTDAAFLRECLLG